MMELSALTNTFMTQTKMQLESQQQRVDGFQAALDKAIEKEDDRALRSACAEFESYFLYIMMKEMRKTVDRKDSLLYSQTEDMFQQLLDEEYGKSLAKAGGIGLADMMYRQLKTEQNAAANVIE